MLMITRALVAATVMATAMPALAGGVGPQNYSSQPRMDRAVFVCATDATTRRAFERQHGSAPVFVTARQALAANNARERWATPRCMTTREHQRLMQLSSSLASR